MSTFAQILNKFRQDAFSERDKGYRFERLMQAADGIINCRPI